MVAGTVRGMLQAREESVKISSRLGDVEAAQKAAARNKGNVVVPARVLDKIRVKATATGEAFLTRIEDQCRKVLWNASGTPVASYPQASVQRQLVGIIEAYLQEPKLLEFATRNPRTRTVQTKRGPRRRRPMKVKDQTKYDAWQASLQYQKAMASARRDAQKQRKLIGMTAAERRADRSRRLAIKDYVEGKRQKPPGVLRQKEATEFVQASDENAFNEGIVAYAETDESVVMLQWTTMRDSRVCETCDPYDLWVVPKDADEVYMFSPQLHPNCRCRWMVVTRAASKAYGIKKTPKRDYPTKIAEPAPGFGGIRRRA